jgi:hypothetical protein
MKIIFKDDQIRVLCQEGALTDVAFITFCELGFVTSGKNKTNSFWGASYFNKLDVPAIGVIPVGGPNWFPESSMKKAAAAINSFTSRYDKIITYGHSMGGYAALKYGRILNATCALAFCPQYSINPLVIGSFDKRYTRYFDPVLNEGMEIRGEDLPEDSYVFFDPYYKTDREHVRLIEEGSGTKGVCRVNCPLTAHTTIRALSGGDTIYRIALAAAARDLTQIHQISRTASRSSSIRPYAAAIHCASRYKMSAFRRIYKNHSENMTPSQRVETISVMHAACQKHKNLEAEEEFVIEWKALSPNEIRPHLIHAGIYLSKNDYLNALSSVSEARKIAPDNESAFIQESLIYEKMGETSHARDGFFRLIGGKNCTPNGLFSAATFLQRNGFVYDSFLVFRQLLLHSPGHDMARMHLMRLMRRLSHYALLFELKNQLPSHDFSKECTDISEQEQLALARYNELTTNPGDWLTCDEKINEAFPNILEIEKIGIAAYHQRETDSLDDYDNHFMGSDLLSPRPNIGFRGNPRHDLHDVLGYKNGEIPSEVDTIVLGNSMVHDLYAPWPDTWPHIMSGIFGKSVVNGSIGAGTPIQNLYALSEFIHTRPKRVVFSIFYGINIYNSLSTVMRLTNPAAKAIFDLSVGMLPRNPLPPSLQKRKDFIAGLGSIPLRKAFDLALQEGHVDCCPFELSGISYIVTPRDSMHRIQTENDYGRIGFSTLIRTLEIFRRMADIWNFQPVVAVFPTRERMIWTTATTRERNEFKGFRNHMEQLEANEKRIDVHLQNEVRRLGLETIFLSNELGDSVRNGFYKSNTVDFHPSPYGKEQIARIVGAHLYS